MNEEEFLLLKSIALSLERIADSLEKNAHNEVDDKVDVAVESSDDTNENENMDYGCSVKEIDVNILIDKLQEKNITVKTYVDSSHENTSLDNVAYFMGNRYNDIRKVYETIKRHLNKPNGFHLDLKNATQSEISASCQLCTTLYDIAFLSEYKYDKSPRYFIHATPNKIPIAINFLTGHWLEIFIRKTIQDSLKSLPAAIEYTYLINPQIILPNGNDFELDVVFLINGEIYWVEGKTENYQHYINKYSHVANMLNLDKNHSFLVLTDVINPNTTYILSKTFDMTIIPVEEFEEEIKYVFHENLIP
ncbi:hypothetical protein BK798_03170 [Methanobrevibacter smithii]|uniref:Uncharacterized protein n=1 Tax=Methanobrevibacter smithii TaxID=2173 RepID=A0A2H4U5T5_METSM|nr:hypothetical protein [Methanobrevibacter smithii]ATZ59480.1 hypothetical protein BK798_03170 [Methanobrevibacter smithii]